jgi:hypothetical protein
MRIDSNTRARTGSKVGARQHLIPVAMSRLNHQTTKSRINELTSARLNVYGVELLKLNGLQNRLIHNFN